MRIFSMFLIFIGYMCASTASWMIRKFGKLTYEQIVFHLNVPLDIDIRLLMSFLQNTVITAAVLVIILYVSTSKISKKQCLLVSLAFLVGSIFWTYQKLNIGSLLTEKNNFKTVGNFYEQHYVEPKNVSITTPKEKRNLVVVFAESMESTYAKAEYFDDNIIPNLTKLAEENINFSHNNGLGGFKNLKGAKYTMAAMIAHYCAIPLKLPIQSSRFRPQNGFLPEATCLYDVLAKDGYNLVFMQGTLKQSSGKDKFFTTHGNTQIFDWNYYSVRDHLSSNKVKKQRFKKRNGKYASFYKRAVRDDRLFMYAKEKISELAAQNKPFALTLLTLDTHFGTENFDSKNCEAKYHSKDFLDEHYFKNVVSCSDSKIAAFVEWIKQQPFYENTEIVIVGDHLTMGNTIFNAKMDRSVYNVYINSAVKVDDKVMKNRKFTALDTMPTILETMGYKIDGHKLGLGVSLMSGEKTLIEGGMNIKKLEQELDKQSKVYNRLLFGK